MKLKGKGFVGTVKVDPNASICQRATKYSCPGLKKHVAASNKCQSFYQREGLWDKGKNYWDLSSSLKVKPKSMESVIPDQFQLGLTMTDNGPIPADSNNSHHTLGTIGFERQIIPNLLQGRITREVITDVLGGGDGMTRVRGTNETTYATPSRNKQEEGCQEIWEEEDGQPPAEQNEDVEVEDAGFADSTDYQINDWETERRKCSYPHPSGQCKAELELMKMLKDHKCPLLLQEKVFNWARKSVTTHKVDFSTATTRKRERILKDATQKLGMAEINFHFKQEMINWLPDNTPQLVSIRPFPEALFTLLTNNELMKEENLSFPHRTDPTSPDNFPPLDQNTEITELHHGAWWSSSWKEAGLDKEKNEILVPIILYMDGISLDNRNQLTLCPLNMTLGIFNVETRSKPHAWTTIYFHPDGEQSGAKPNPRENIQNLHNGIKAAMKPFKDLCDGKRWMQWDYLRYGGKTWKVKMRFAIAYIIGDTELHDKLCARFGSYSSGTKSICRHCDCPTEEITNPEVVLNKRNRGPNPIKVSLWTPERLCPMVGQNRETFFKKVSHHDIDNVFHSLDFGSNTQNIHFATPGENLHMHQLGVAKRAIESFKELVEGTTKCSYAGAGELWKPRASVVSRLGLLGQCYGADLSRQSDRNFPRTKFGQNILHTTKKEGHDFAGILLCILLTINSKRGKKILGSERFIKKQIKVIEMILSMEEFLKHGRLTVKERGGLEKVVEHFIQTINETCLRSGMGSRLIKNHLYFHLQKYIELWGPPNGWDSAPSEAHHKTEIKAPSKNTQCNASTLIEQTARRQSECMVLEMACSRYGLCERNKVVGREKPEMSGSWYRIMRGENGTQPTMEWDRSSNRNRPFLPFVVLKYCCERVLPYLENKDLVWGFTDHNRFDGNSYHLFRSNPSFRTDSGQNNGIWMDWAMFRFDTGNYPSHIMCFLDLKTRNGLDKNMLDAEGREPTLEDNGIYAVVRCFKKEPEKTQSTFIRKGALDETKFYIVPTESIVSEVAVVAHREVEEDTTTKEWFVVSNQNTWLENFGRDKGGWKK